MVNDLVTIQEMAEATPEVTLTETELDALVARVRAFCGWHIAPRRTETITISSRGAAVIPLPTLRLVNVTAVRCWDGTAMAPLDSWDARTGWDPMSCTINLGGSRFPAGARALEVDVEHGFDSAPLDLLVAIAALAGPRSIVQESVLGHSVTFSQAPAVAVAEPISALALFRLPRLP